MTTLLQLQRRSFHFVVPTSPPPPGRSRLLFPKFPQTQCPPKRKSIRIHPPLIIPRIPDQGTQQPDKLMRLGTTPPPPVSFAAIHRRNHENKVPRGKQPHSPTTTPAKPRAEAPSRTECPPRTSNPPGWSQEAEQPQPDFSPAADPGRGSGKLRRPRHRCIR